MAPKGGTYLLLLILACAATAMRPGVKPYVKGLAKKLMRKCQDKGYPEPKTELLSTVFNKSDSPAVDSNSGQSIYFLPAFMKIMSLFSSGKDSSPQIPMDDSDKMTSMMWNCSYLPRMIKMMRNSSEPSVCYMRAFVAPLAWAILTNQSEDNMDSDDYESLLWAAEPVLQTMPPIRVILPDKVPRQKVKREMELLKLMYENMPEHQRTRVVEWVKQQITQNDFNCTMKPSPDSRFSPMERCNSSVKWLDLDMMGPYLSHLSPSDVDSSPKEKLCEFFRLNKFKASSRMVTKMNPSLASRFLKRFRACTSGEKEFAEHVDKLGKLACFYYAAPKMAPKPSRKLLPLLNECDNPEMKKLKKNLAKFVLSNSTDADEALGDLGLSIALLPPEQLLAFPSKKLKEVLKTLGLKVKWSKSQMRALVKTQLGNMTCKQVPREELMALRSVAAGLPNCVLKHVDAQEILNDTEALKDISKRLRKGQRKALLQELSKDVDPSELVQKLNDPILPMVPLSTLAKANISSLDKLEDKKWSRSQAAYLARKMYDIKPLRYRKLHSVLQGITCKIIDEVADSDVQDMIEDFAETPQWLLKVQVGCAAQKLFKILEKKKADYFKAITPDKLDKIPTMFLLYLPPPKIKDLPISVCPNFLDKMEMANLSLLPLRFPSRLGLTKKALFCLANGADLSRLTTQNVSRLGPLLCELQPSQLRLMAPDVVNASLQNMASCQHIPKRHRADLIQLVKQTFGDPSNWPAETMEELGPLLLMDDDATAALPRRPWMKNVLVFLKSRLSVISKALKKKLFDLTTATTSAASRKKRAASSNDVSSTTTDRSSVNADVPTEQLIEELEMNNVYWTSAQLNQMASETFLATVEILGNIPDYSEDQLPVLSVKATEVFGPVSELTESVLVQLGCISQAFSNIDLEKLPFSLDIVEDLAPCGWNESQIELVWKAVASYNNLTAQQLGAAEIVQLGKFICGLNSTEIEQLNKDAFRDAVGSMHGVQCSFRVMQHLKRVAVSAFGVPNKWTAAHVSELGNIVAGLDASELASLDPSVFAFLSQSSIPLIPPKNFAALSDLQLKALGPDLAEMVTSEQQNALNDKQVAALESAMTGSRDESLPPEKYTDGSASRTPTEVAALIKRAPSMSVEGIFALMKPLLFLLTGFLLL